MSKDPAFLFYPNDWIGGTMGMTFEEKGAYMEVLMLQFNRGHMSYHMIGQTLGQEAGRIWLAIKDKFDVDANGMFFNSRLESEKTKRKAYTASRNNNRSGTNQPTKKKNNEGGHMKGHMEDEDRTYDYIVKDEIDVSQLAKHEEFKQQALKDEIWQQSLFMQKVLKPENIEFALRDYNIHLIQQVEKKTTSKDYKQHFVNWVKLKKEKHQKQTKTSDRL